MITNSTIEIIRNRDGEVYTLFDPSGVATTHTKVCIIKRKMKVDHVGIAPPDLWKELKKDYKVEVLSEVVD